METVWTDMMDKIGEKEVVRRRRRREGGKKVEKFTDLLSSTEGPMFGVMCLSSY
jgi:hypothetical protein